MFLAREAFHQALRHNNLDLNWTPKGKPIEILEDWIEVYPGEDEEDTFVLYHPDHGALHYRRSRDEDYYDDDDGSSFW